MRALLFLLVTFFASSVVGQTAVLKLDYRVECGEIGNHVPAVPGSLRLDDRILRFELWAGTNQRQLVLGSPANVPASVVPEIGDSPACRVHDLRSVVETEDSIVQRHSPFLVVREDQYRKRTTDIPLVMGYSRRETARSYTLKYTIVFSDEDSLSTTAKLDAQMARYGRRTDIEWVYEVELEKGSHRPLARRYHGDLFGGAGHSTKTFQGEFLAGTEHPILYVIASHNVFRDRPHSGFQRETLVGYHLFPADEIATPLAREWLMMRHLWTFYASDAESRREGKLSSWFTDYLFVRVRGALSRGGFTAVATLDSGEKIRSGHGRGDVNRLGEDLWGSESFTAVPLAESTHGKLNLEKTSFATPRLSLSELGFYRIRADRNGYRLEDATSSFTCRLDDLRTECEF